MAQSEVGEWFRSVPTVTRFLFTSTLALTLAANFGIVRPDYLLLTTTAFTKFEFWRILTCFTFGGRLGFGFVMNLYFLYQYSSLLENGIFEGKKADYVFFLLFCATLEMICGVLFGFFLLGTCLVFSMIYLWSQINQEQIVSFMFGLRFKAMYLPWVLLGWFLLLGDIPFIQLTGILCGHLYYFLEYLYPVTSGVRLLKTPQFLYNFFPQERTTVHGFGTPPPGRNQPEQRNPLNPFGGRGQRLGGN